MKEVCGTCKHMKRGFMTTPWGHSPHPEGHLMLCTRHPPVALDKNDGPGTVYDAGAIAWPVMGWHLSCGDWEESPTPEPEPVPEPPRKCLTEFTIIAGTSTLVPERYRGKRYRCLMPKDHIGWCGAFLVGGNDKDFEEIPFA